MQTWWFMRRMVVMQSWAPEPLRCGWPHWLKIWGPQVLCKETPPEQCTQCEEGYTNAVKWYFRIDNHETKSSPLPLHFGQKPSNTVPWDQAVEPYLLWQLSVNLMRRCWKTPRGLMRIGPADPCHDSDVDCWWLKSSELVCVYHNFPFGCRNWREPLDWGTPRYQRFGT